MTGPRLRVQRLRGAGLAVGVAAACAMIVVGCQSVTEGSASLDTADVPLYRASTSSSIEASVSSSVAREAERQEELIREAVRTSCEALSSSSVDAIAAVNGYVDAFNANSPDLVATAGPAVDALNSSADVVGSSISDPLSVELRDALFGWVDAATGLSAAIASDAAMSDFNVAIDQLNESQDVALTLCDAAY